METATQVIAWKFTAARPVGADDASAGSKVKL